MYYIFTNRNTLKTCVVSAENLSSAKQKFIKNNKANEIFECTITKTFLIS